MLLVRSRRNLPGCEVYDTGLRVRDSLLSLGSKQNQPAERIYRGKMLVYCSKLKRIFFAVVYLLLDG
jgi:hypothetical protein